MDGPKLSLVEKLIRTVGIQTEAAEIIISVAIILFFGFLMTRVTKKLKLPNVTAYILTGILLSPIWKLFPSAPIDGVIPQKVIDGMDFLTDIALSFIAFGAGSFFRIRQLKQSGGSVLIVTLLEALSASVAVFLLCRFALGVELSFSLVLAALASATAPASTLMTIRQTHAKGEYVDLLLEVVALDDTVALLLYSIAISVCLSMQTGGSGVSFAAVGVPLLYNVACLVLGVALGFFLKFLIPKRSSDNKIIIVVATLFLFCGVCALVEQSPLLGCMAMGMTYANLEKDDKLFKQLNYFSPPIMLCFFVLSGMRFDLTALFSADVVGRVPLYVVALVYFFARILGKYGGAYAGCALTKKDKKIRNFLGFGLIPQAGVAIGLAAMGARILGGEAGNMLQTVILASGVLYELVGPGMSKLGLYLSGSYSIENVAPAAEVAAGEPALTSVEILSRQIRKISEEQARENNAPSEEERAFDEAAEEFYENFGRNNRFLNRR